MALPLSAISLGMGGISPVQTSMLQPGNRTASTADDAGGTSFGDVLAQQLDKVSGAQARADDLALQAATGDLASIQEYTIASTEAQLLTQLTVAVRNRAVEAFNEIMRMQV